MASIKLDTYGIENLLNQHQVPLTSRSEAVMVYVASKIASKLDIPSSPIDGNLKLHYVNMVAGRANELLGECNEQMALDVGRAKDLIYSLWRSRYDMVHHPLQSTLAALRQSKDIANPDAIKLAAVALRRDL